MMSAASGHTIRDVFLCSNELSSPSNLGTSMSSLLAEYEQPTSGPNLLSHSGADDDPPSFASPIKQPPQKRADSRANSMTSRSNSGMSALAGSELDLVAHVFESVADDDFFFEDAQALPEPIPCSQSDAEAPPHHSSKYSANPNGMIEMVEENEDSNAPEHRVPLSPVKRNESKPACMGVKKSVVFKKAQSLLSCEGVQTKITMIKETLVKKSVELHVSSGTRLNHRKLNSSARPGGRIPSTSQPSPSTPPPEKSVEQIRTKSTLARTRSSMSFNVLNSRRQATQQQAPRKTQERVLMSLELMKDKFQCDVSEKSFQNICFVKTKFEELEEAGVIKTAVSQYETEMSILGFSSFSVPCPLLFNTHCRAICTEIIASRSSKALEDLKKPTEVLNNLLRLCGIYTKAGLRGPKKTDFNKRDFLYSTGYFYSRDKQNKLRHKMMPNGQSAAGRDANMESLVTGTYLSNALIMKRLRRASIAVR
mmetsp:Transcript_85147/g.124584  ORF Transcript_85147/g.124584 Transcript_85147/m.124584 type:complete len:480 (-) Transcript_85147:105-1544(-)